MAWSWHVDNADSIIDKQHEVAEYNRLNIYNGIVLMKLILKHSISLTNLRQFK